MWGNAAGGMNDQISLLNFWLTETSTWSPGALSILKAWSWPSVVAV
jgi:hypothetical protein